MKHISLLVLGACAPGAPDMPSFQQHVSPILAANCVRCHGVPAIGGAPQTLRLDVIGNYDRPTRDGTGVEAVYGSAALSFAIMDRVNGANDAPIMPPRFPLDDYQIETLERWDAAGAPRGTPNEGNRPPTATVTGFVKTVEEVGIDVRVKYLIDVEVRDPDPDIVGGALYARLGANRAPIGLLRPGTQRIVWITTNVPRATHGLEVDLDDGGAEVSASVGQIDVDGP